MVASVYRGRVKVPIVQQCCVFRCVFLPRVHFLVGSIFFLGRVALGNTVRGLVLIVSVRTYSGNFLRVRRERVVPCLRRVVD